MLNNLMPDKRYIPGRLGFRSTVNWTATRESSFALVPNTALESPTFPTIRSWPYKWTKNPLWSEEITLLQKITSFQQNIIRVTKVTKQHLLNQSYCCCSATKTINTLVGLQFPIHNFERRQKGFLKCLKDFRVFFCFFSINRYPRILISRCRSSLFYVHASCRINANLLEDFLTRNINFPMGIQF